MNINRPTTASRARLRVIVLATVFARIASVAAVGAEGTVLGIDGSQFTLNGKPAFLLGLSYYGGLGAPEEFARRDLDDTQRFGFNWLRVWITWESFGNDVSAVDSQVRLRQPYWETLKWLVAECDRRGLVVDVTLTRGKGTKDAPAVGRLPDFESHHRAVETVVNSLKQYRNWYLDLANERDVRDQRYVPPAELKALREFVRKIDPPRLVTASLGGHDISEQDLRDALSSAGLDFLAPHRPRHPESPAQTETRTRECLALMKQIGRVAPVHYQEPFRRGYTAWEPSPADFLTDLRGAVAGGAAGWCFHNGSQGNSPDNGPRRSFDLSVKRLFDQIDAEEQKVVQEVATLVRRPPVPKVSNSRLLQGGDTPTDATSSAVDKVQVQRSGAQPGHYLTWRGKPVLLVGDSVTQGWMECGTNFNQTAYVDALASRGMNLLMLWAFKGTSARLQQQDKRLGYDSPELWPWAGSTDDHTFDLLRFNPAYFDRLRQLVAYAERKGIVVLITVHDGWPKTSFDGHPFNRALGNGPLADRRNYVELADYDHEMPQTYDPTWNWQQRNQFFQERFCATVITELDAYSNVLYEMFNEGEWYDRTQRRQHEEHFLTFFRKRCSNMLLSNSDHITGDGAHQNANLDGVTLHPQNWVGHFRKFAAGFNAAPPKPYLYSEPVPEFDGEKPSLDDVRRSVWETTLAGAGWVNQNDPSFGWDPRTAIAAKSAARDHAYDLAGHCARFFNQSGVRFWEMAPAGKLASTGICLARPGNEYVVYAPSGGKFTVDFSATSQKPLQARWYNPRTGKFRSAESITGGNGSEQFQAPFPGDAVLHLVHGVPPALPPKP